MKYEEEVLKLHSENLNSNIIAKHLGISRSKVYKILKKYNLKSNNNKPKQPRLFTEEEVNSMIKLYKQGMTCEEIYYIYKDRCSSKETIQGLLSRRINMRNRGKRILFDENYFENIDAERKAYWLGFIYADGNITNNRLRIEIKSDDKYLLEQLKSDMKSKNKICKDNSTHEYNGYKIHKDNVYIGFCSNKLKQDLSKWGVIPNKTFKIMELPSINKDLMRHFIRGYFDGDGTVYLDNINHSDNRSIFGFYGQHDFLLNIKNELINEINISNRKIFDKESVSMITFSKHNDVVKFYKYIYENATIFLTRKRKLFDIYLSN